MKKSVFEGAGCHLMFPIAIGGFVHACSLTNVLSSPMSLSGHWSSLVAGLVQHMLLRSIQEKHWAFQAVNERRCLTGKLQGREREARIGAPDSGGDLDAQGSNRFERIHQKEVLFGLLKAYVTSALNGSASLPHGTGKAFRVAVFAEGAAADEARAAGADVVGGQELIEGIKNGTVKVDFDKCIATHQIMPLVGKQISKVLRRLTPNAKNGTVTNDISRVVREARRNIDFKKDKSAIVHVGLGKVTFPEEALRENVGAFVNALLLAKPAGLKKRIGPRHIYFCLRLTEEEVSNIGGEFGVYVIVK
ncbi:unnamed protein product [Ilex paraguariensis]|uniref:CL1 n=1 Tax=Ilex paraguariensis TaxID=185542 RepID=A0ABC8TG06_9AQUA